MEVRFFLEAVIPNFFELVPFDEREKFVLQKAKSKKQKTKKDDTLGKV